MSTDFPAPQPDDKHSVAACPSCGAALQPGTVLCVACGYHLKLERHLATAVERELPRPVDPNPFAPSAIADPTIESPRRSEHIADLTEAGARKAKAIVSEASSAYVLVLLGLCCWPIGLILLPWYGLRLWSWYQLNHQFSELRYPNGFSKHAELSVSFQDSKFRLWVGVVAGACYWSLMGLSLVLRIVNELLESVQT